VNVSRIAKLRLRNLRLAGKRFTKPAEAVRWHLAMQSQDYAPAKWSIGQRATGLVDADVDRALLHGEIVRTHVLRPTWHFIAREDFRWLMALSGPRVRRGLEHRYRDLGLDARTLRRAERVMGRALENGTRLTRNELAEVLAGSKIDPGGQRLPFILMHAELEATICSGGPEGRQQTYALADERIPTSAAPDRDDALRELARRYLRSHGPATAKDLSWWSGLTLTDVRRAFSMLEGEVESEDVDGLTYWSAGGGAGRLPAARAATLLQTYDELVVGYQESRFVGDPGAATAKDAWSGRTFPSGGVLLGARIGGHWRRTVGKGRLDVDVHLYETPTPKVSTAVERAVGELGRFFGLPVDLTVDRRLPPRS